MDEKRKMLVTSALPYANGSIHIGHLVEYIQTDIWVRFQRLIGNDCYYMCADDTHGTPVMLSAKKQGICAEELIERMQREHVADFKEFDISFDNYYTTNSSENKKLSEFIYLEAKKNGAIYEKQISQLFCDNCGIFLPDRFIRGTCPECKAPDQYGDSCEKCSATYSPVDLIGPKCAECANTPRSKPTVHHFFKLSAFSEKLKQWIDEEGHVQPEIRNKLQEWFKQGLKDWDISRDEPYFGFKIPGTQDKYFYVWMDAPIGYIATTQNWCAKSGLDFERIWRGSEFEIHHIIGKDILYFHTLFWPAMLMASGFTLPTGIHIHGFLTINGEKMSKSRGTFIRAREYLDNLDPELLRYYYASKLSSSIDDIDINWDDFVFKVNSDVVNKVVNIASRLGAVVNKKLGGKLSIMDDEGEMLVRKLLASGAQIRKYYDDFEFNRAMKEIVSLADLTNVYIDAKAPWDAAKKNPQGALEACTCGLNALRVIMTYLKPVLPRISRGTEEFLNIGPLTWEGLENKILNCRINAYEHLAKRLDPKQVDFARPK